VRDEKVLTMEDAVRKMTSLPARILGLRDRGQIHEGFAADVVVFDPATVGAGPLRRVYDLPAGADRLVADAGGIEAVIVNGTVVRRGGRDAVAPDGALPGALLRSS
jgi:N-acyl-D-aspartate/D-glutamate deacylase